MGINKVKLTMNSFFDIFFARSRILGFMILSSVILFSSTVAQADMVFDFQMKLAKKENAEAQFKVGEMYETGFGVKQDLSKAMEWVTKAANKGHETAGFKLLYWDIEKNGMSSVNKINLGSLKAKAKLGNSQAIYYLGKMTAYGVGFERNTNNAIKWLSKAALAGIPEAESELVIVREHQQREIAAKRRIDEKKRADLKARRDRERQAQLERNIKIKAQRAEEKARAEATLRQAAEEKHKHELALANEKIANEKAANDEKTRLLKLKQAEQREIQRVAKKKAATIKKRAEAAAKQKASFESDPCSGKSARFLSTCK